MVFTDADILKAMDEGKIVIEPFRHNCLGPNSYDVHLGRAVGWYSDNVLDCRKKPSYVVEEIPDEGLLISPGRLYLGVTEEYTETLDAVPYLDGKSSVGRLGLFIHATAGRGDIGFCNHWTLELTAVQPVRIYRGMPIGQLTYHTCGAPLAPYGSRASSKYQGRDPLPQPSKMHLNFEEPPR